MNPITRRDFAAMTAAAALLPHAALAQTSGMLARPIPHGGEKLPAVGFGTAVIFRSATPELRAKAETVVKALVAGGGTLIDTASSYGDAEAVIGDAVAATKLRAKTFIATKLESADANELKQSLAKLKTAKLDLLQLHNVRDPNQSLAQFRDWKTQGVTRYIGITSTYHGDFGAIESTTRREKPDFVQIDYSLDNRLAEERVLPAAADAGSAVLTALPFGRGRLFRAVRDKKLPDWAAEFDAKSWAQFFLKFLLGDPRITAVIPGTTDPVHMTDNLGAGLGRLPDAAQRRRMVQFVEAL